MKMFTLELFFPDEEVIVVWYEAENEKDAIDRFLDREDRWMEVERESQATEYRNVNTIVSIAVYEGVKRGKRRGDGKGL